MVRGFNLLGGVKKILRGQSTLLGGNLSLNVTLPESIDINNAVLVHSFIQSGAESLGKTMTRGRIINNTTITFDRSVPTATNQSVTINWEVIIYEGVKTLQRVSGTLPTAQSSLDITINAVDMSKAYLVFSCTLDSSIYQGYQPDWQEVFTPYRLVNSTTVRVSFLSSAHPRNYHLQVIEFN